MIAQYPYDITVTNAADNRSCRITLNRQIRYVKGVRVVYEGRWQGRPVIVKQFLHPIKGKRHVDREWRNSRRMIEKQIVTPQPLFFGKAQDQTWVVINEQIPAAENLFELFEQSDHLVQSQILNDLADVLAAMHKNGVLHNDFHLGNFLRSQGEIYVLDPADAVFHQEAVSKKAVLAQLAALIHPITGNRIDQQRKSLIEHYYIARQWQMNLEDVEAIYKNLHQHKKKLIRRELKKAMRTSRRFVKIKKSNTAGVFDKTFLPHDQIEEFIEAIDSNARSGEILKEGNTCLVSRMDLNGRSIVIKRYNHLGLFHSLRHTIKGSRARHCWLNSHRLKVIGINIPHPLGFIEVRRMGILWTSYFICEYAAGKSLYYHLADGDMDDERRSQVITHVKESLADMNRFRTTHNDLKPTNIMIHDTDICLLDIDAVKHHHLKWFATLKYRRSLDYFKWRLSSIQ